MSATDPTCVSGDGGHGRRDWRERVVHPAPRRVPPHPRLLPHPPVTSDHPPDRRPVPESRDLPAPRAAALPRAHRRHLPLHGGQHPLLVPQEGAAAQAGGQTDVLLPPVSSAQVRERLLRSLPVQQTLPNHGQGPGREVEGPAPQVEKRVILCHEETAGRGVLRTFLY